MQYIKTYLANSNSYFNEGLLAWTSIRNQKKKKKKKRKEKREKKSFYRCFSIIIIILTRSFRL